MDSHLVLKQTESCEAELQPNVERASSSHGFKPSEGLNTKLETALLSIFENDLEMARQAFRLGKHLCEICFDEKDGAEFHYLDECRHFFCTDCLKAHSEQHG